MEALSIIMQNRTRIPRWLIEDDPAWQRTLDSDLGLLKWTKKGTNIQAVSSAASIFCEVSEVLETNDQTNVRNIASDLARSRYSAMEGTDITKYLSSRYLNHSFATKTPQKEKNNIFTNYDP
jgi:hypothetical protein